jgi:uncharacterized protein YcbK (DUF882 family)
MNIFQWLINKFRVNESTVAVPPAVTVSPKPTPKLTPKEEFQEELNKRKIKHFSADEIFFKGASDAKLKLNTEPPKELWSNMWKTIEIADKAREKFGKPLKIASAYRSPKYNKAIGGAPKSHHVNFNALDLRTTAPKTLHKILKDMRAKGMFKGGLGLYKTFVHLDTRGNNADW